jgi:hypothetical protein
MLLSCLLKEMNPIVFPTSLVLPNELVGHQDYQENDNP